MTASKNGFIYEGIVNGFNCAKWLMKQRPQLKGLSNLKNLPSQVIFTVTHDSYFEIPSLASVYKAIDPRPVFTVMAKEDFLNDRYLSTHFFKENIVLGNVLKLVDMTGVPKAIFRKLNLITIPRPFADSHLAKYGNVRQQISSQFVKFGARISDGFSTLIFPEGTTWGYGGLRKMRSAVYQLVSASFEQHGKRIHMLPINVKVDKLVQGWKDVYINIGKPRFFIKPKAEFNQQLYEMLQKLHIITFSQVIAYHFKLLAVKAERTGIEIKIKREQLIEQLEKTMFDLHKRVTSGVLPDMDQNLLHRAYLVDKLNRFLPYCEKNKYLYRLTDEQSYRLNSDLVLADHPVKLFRKSNPIGFHANELASLGESDLKPVFER